MKNQNTEKSRVYKEALRASNRFNETNDCFPIALGIATDMGYEKAHRLCQLMGRYNRKGTKGLTIGATMNTLKMDGWKIEEFYPTQVNTRGKIGKISTKTIGEKYPEGNYIALATNHALAIKDGKVHDWTEGKRKLVYKMYKLTKPEDK